MTDYQLVTKQRIFMDEFFDADYQVVTTEIENNLWRNEFNTTFGQSFFQMLFWF